MKTMYLAAVFAVFLIAVLIPHSYAQSTYYDEEEFFHENHHHEEDSPTDITTGTPQSSTDNAAQETAVDAAIISPMDVLEEFSDETKGDSAPAADTDNAAVQGGSGSLQIDAGAGSYEVGGVEADFMTLRIPYSKKVNDRGTLQFSIPVSVLNLSDAVSKTDSSGNTMLKDAKVYGYGINAGYSYEAVKKSDGKKYRWKITPSSGLFYKDSSDLNQGSLVYNLGLSSSFAYMVAPNWVVNIGNSISLAWNNGIKDYPDPVRDNQQVLINGIQFFHLMGRWTPYSYVMDTRYLNNGFIDNYQTYAVGVAFKLTQKRSIRFSVLYDNGNNFDSLKATLGASWKF